MIPTVKSMQNRLRIKQLTLIAALDEFRSLRKVAESMHLSQPAATKMLHEIEETLGVQLFERLPRGMRPTVFGESVINYAKLMLADLDNLRKQLVAQEAGAVGEVSVGSIMAPAPGLLTRTIIELRARYPLIKISVVVDTSDNLLLMLEQGKLDIVLGRIPSPGEHPDINFEVVDNEALSVVAGVHHPLSQVRRLELADLAGQSWILQPPTSPMRQLLELAFQEANIASPANLVETASILATTTLLQGTEMISVVPTSVAKHYATSGMICILPVRIKLQLEPYGIITRRERIPAPAVSVFQDCLRGLAVPVHLRRSATQ
ncbi:MAG TPA: LysR family transcriptional regulator [Telluria sp.]|nr:LysR family transcriptional regulator [Telluria sp.]